ncbi:MAG: hypothetical protein U0T74_01730 [Chitinophagales bacterium]
MRKILALIRNPKIWLIAVYMLIAVWLCRRAYYGQYSFLTTTYVYSLVATVLYFVFKKVKLSTNIYLICYSVLIALFAAEFTLRFITKTNISYGEQNNNGYTITYRYNKWGNVRFIEHEGRPDLYTLQFDSGELRRYTTIDFSYPDFYCNKLGFRGVLPDTNKNIILALGDSFTEGAGTPNDSNYTELMRKQIQSSDTSLDILNAGVSGNDIFFDWQMVYKLENKYHLKQLLFLMNNTDVCEVASRGGSERFMKDGRLEYTPGKWWEPFYAVSFVFRLIVHSTTHLDNTLHTSEERDAEHRKAIHKIYLLVKNEIVPWSKSKRVKATIVLHPLEYELKDKANNWEYDSLRNSLQSIQGLNVVDCFAEIKAKAGSRKIYWQHDQHFKPEGYAILANYIYQNCFEDSISPK